MRELFLVTAVTLAFDEMRTPHASGREICVRKLGNAYQQQQKDTNDAASLLPGLSNDSAKKVLCKRCAFPSQYWLAFRDRFHCVPIFAYAVRIASMIA